VLCVDFLVFEVPAVLGFFAVSDFFSVGCVWGLEESCPCAALEVLDWLDACAVAEVEVSWWTGRAPELETDKSPHIPASASTQLRLRLN